MHRLLIKFLMKKVFKIIYLKSLTLIFMINSCSYPDMIRNELVFENNFENLDLNSIDGGEITLFNNTNVLGDFNNDGFTLFLEDIGDHDYVFISFDLYIHGSWDGNFNGFNENDKPDKWIMELNLIWNYIKTLVLITQQHFLIAPCFSNYCLRQSYPESYPFENNPKTGSFKTNLVEICTDSIFGEKTTLYQIEKGFKSSGNKWL